MTRPRRYLLWLVAALLLGFGLRSLRLDWQPLWWDEGYSVYFATEPLGRMVWLTAHDIHPPLYYALLHAWAGALGTAQPAVLRWLSIVLGGLALAALAWLAHTLFPRRPRTVVIAVLLLAISPLHIFYSQEVRMYGLALLLGLVATTFWWQALADAGQGRFRLARLVGYWLAASAGLYTLYYLALLLLAQLLWTGWWFRHRWRAAAPLFLTTVAVGLTYLPWLAYALPKLAPYVADKVTADQDQPLGLLTYVGRHSGAFVFGHVAPFPVTGIVYAALGAATLVIVLLAMRKPWRDDADSPASAQGATSSPTHALWMLVLLPAGAAFLLNLRLPFFPHGGERLLLFALPYGLLLVAEAIDRRWLPRLAGPAVLAGLVLLGSLGILVYYTTPRYSEHDYRPLIRRVLQQGTASDSVVAVFPWQVGYWRAYTPQNEQGDLYTPQPALLGEGALAWNDTIAQALDAALAHGVVWFPAPLSFGSRLPAEIEAHLAADAVNVENRWYSPSTRLSAWAQLPEPAFAPVGADFGPVRLDVASVSPQSVASANQVIGIALAWQTNDPSSLDSAPLHVTLRLADDADRIWAQRDYEPLGSLAAPTVTGEETESLGLIVPVGLPPGEYTLEVTVANAGDHAPLTASLPDGTAAHSVPLARLNVTAPSEALPPVRLPAQTTLDPPVTADGLSLVGYTKPTTDSPLLAGTELPLTLFMQNRGAGRPTRELVVRVLDQRGDQVAGWQGWPLPGYPTHDWPAGALVQAPISVDLPADLADGAYRLDVAWFDPASDSAGEPADLGRISVVQRPAHGASAAPQYMLSTPVQFGAHARLLGYDLNETPAGWELALHWEALQPLRPAHHIFVHLDGADGVTLAQQDGPPTTADGLAPTGSWRTGESLVTQHWLARPANTPSAPVIRAGLYVPGSGVRLPATVGGQPAGDSATLATSP